MKITKKTHVLRTTFFRDHSVNIGNVYNLLLRLYNLRFLPVTTDARVS